MIDLLGGRAGQLLAETLLHFLWQGAALALFLKLMEPLLRSVHDRYSASLGTLIVMLAMPLATYCVLANRDVARPASALPHVETTDTLVADHTTLDPAPALARLQPVFVGLWLLGVLLLAARLLVGYAATLWLRGDRRPLPAQLAERVAWLGRRLGVVTRCRVFLSARIDEAIAVGCFKPLVLVPLAWASELPPSALEAVIAHELAHIRRWDLWATLLQRLAETLLFYHPAVWWLSRRLSQQRELCCDALAVSATRRPAEYVLALETLARRASAPPLSLATSFLGGGNMNLLDRVRHVLTGGSSHKPSSWWPAGLAALAAPALAAMALSGWSLLPATVTADDERETPVETRAEDDPDDAADLLELAVRVLAAEEKDGAADDESEEAARSKKEIRAREKKRRDVKEALDSEVREAKVRSVKKAARDDDLDLAKFRPETEREERLLAVIKKLQAQIKDASGSARKVKSASEALNKKAPPESKDPKALDEYKKFFGKKLEQQDVESYKRALNDKEALLAKERKTKEMEAIAEKKAYHQKLLEKEALTEKEAILRKLSDAEAGAEKEAYQKKLLEKEAINEKEAILKKLKDAEAGADKDAYVRKFKDPKAKPERTGDANDLEERRRLLDLREAQLKKAAAELERRARELGEEKKGPRREGERKDEPRRKSDREEGDRKDGGRREEKERAANKEQAANTYDEFIRALVEKTPLIEPSDDGAEQ